MKADDINESERYIYDFLLSLCLILLDSSFPF